MYLFFVSLEIDHIWESHASEMLFQREGKGNEGPSDFMSAEGKRRNSPFHLGSLYMDFTILVMSLSEGLNHIWMTMSHARCNKRGYS